jgi:uncharacterized membrane protein required for colicin V production
MNVLDLIIIALILVNIVLGYMFGLIRRAIVFVGLFVGTWAATLTSVNTSNYVATTLNWQAGIWTHVVTYTGIIVLVVLLFEALGFVYARQLEALVAPVFDTVLGSLAGGILGAFEVTLILVVGVAIVTIQMPSGSTAPPALQSAAHLFAGSFLAPHFYGLEPVTRAIFAMVLPGNISTYFTQLLSH